MTAIAIKTSEALASLPVPIFLAGRDPGEPERVTLHVAPGYRRASLKADAEAALARAGLTARCRVKTLRHRRLEKSRSVQALLAAFAHDAVLHDPTGSVTRGNALLRCGQALRGALGEAAAGLYFAPDSRTLFVLCRVADQPARRAIEARAAAAIQEWRVNDPAAFELAVRLCVAVPRLALVPLDDSSPVDPRANWRGRLQAGLVAGGVATLLGALFPGLALADGPAVSAVNAKASVSGGELNSRAAGIVEGTVTVPLGYSFGGQLDVAGGGSNGRGLWGVAGQGFWRDPGIGLIGAFLTHAEHGVAAPSAVKTKSSFVNREGVEGEAYLGQFTPTVAGGYQHGNIKNAGGFLVLDLAWYPIDNLQLSGGGDINSAHSRALFGAEYQFGLDALPGLTTFAEAGISGQRDSYALAGLRIYFGPAKTLIRRHREDDPNSPIVGGIGTTYNSTGGGY